MYIYICIYIYTYYIYIYIFQNKLYMLYICIYKYILHKRTTVIVNVSSCRFQLYSWTLNIINYFPINNLAC